MATPAKIFGAGCKFGFDCALDFITGVGGASIL